MPQFAESHHCTEAVHKVHATITGAEAIDIGSGRPFRPERITVTYRWRTQLGHTGWREVTVELAGPWQPLPGETREPHGSACLVSSHLNELPGWVRAFVEQHFPNHTRLRVADPPPDSVDEVWFRTHAPARVDGIDVLEVRGFRPGGAGELPTALALTHRGHTYSTHLLIYDPAHDCWSAEQGHYRLPTRHEAAQNLASRAAER